LSENSSRTPTCFARDKCDPKTKPDATSDMTDTSFGSQSNQENKDTSTSSSQQDSNGRLSLGEQPDMIGESIMELEELANKIRWLKGLLQFGATWSNDMKPSWKFLSGSKQ
jgi:hypothetical protein